MAGLNFALRENPIKKGSFYIVLKDNRYSPDEVVADRVGLSLDEYKQFAIEQYAATLTKAGLLQWNSREEARDALDWLESRVVIFTMAEIE